MNQAREQSSSLTGIDDRLLVQGFRANALMNGSNDFLSSLQSVIAKITFRKRLAAVSTGCPLNNRVASFVNL